MKRALAIAVALCTLGFAGFSQIALKGSWTATMCFLPSTTLSSTFTITYSVAGIDITSTSTFSATAFTSQSFSLKGAFGPFTVSGGMWFNPVVPEYQRATLTTSFDFGGVAIGFTMYHFAAGTWPTAWGTNPCTQTPSLKYVFTGKIDPVTVTLTLRDCCTGTEFYNVLIGLKGVGLCCGITYDAELSFLKTGFDYVLFTLKGLPGLCCGITLEASVKFTTTAKIVEVKPKFAGFGEACFTVYADLQYDGGRNADLYLNAIRIDGWKISCTLGDCSTLEFVTFLSPENIGLYMTSPFLAGCGEFEWVKATFCGSGCCGGKYTVSLTTFFGTNGGLFDITRMVYDIKIPIMANFTLNLSGTVAAAACATNTFCIGWTFTF